jgi:hypothetical protein
MLRLDQKGLYRRLERLMAQLRQALEAHGVDATAALDIFDTPGASIDWAVDAEETSKGRPSMAKGGHEWR